MYCKTHTLFE